MILKLIFVALLMGQVFSEEGKREKRYIFINPAAPITLGFILNMPISLALPTIANRGRSLDLMNQFDKNTEFIEDLFFDPVYEEELSKMQIYFAHLEIPTVGCQERLLCEISGDAEKYSPMSDMFLKEVKARRGEVKIDQNSLFWRYTIAVGKGFGSSPERCYSEYPNCPVTGANMLNIPVLRVWQFLASRLSLQLV